MVVVKHSPVEVLRAELKRFATEEDERLVEIYNRSNDGVDFKTELRHLTALITGLENQLTKSKADVVMLRTVLQDSHYPVFAVDQSECVACGGRECATNCRVRLALERT